MQSIISSKFNDEMNAIKENHTWIKFCCWFLSLSQSLIHEYDALFGEKQVLCWFFFSHEYDEPSITNIVSFCFEDVFLEYSWVN